MVNRGIAPQLFLVSLHLTFSFLSGWKKGHKTRNNITGRRFFVSVFSQNPSPCKNRWNAVNKIKIWWIKLILKLASRLDGWWINPVTRSNCRKQVYPTLCLVVRVFWLHSRHFAYFTSTLTAKFPFYSQNFVFLRQSFNFIFKFFASYGPNPLLYFWHIVCSLSF